MFIDELVAGKVGAFDPQIPVESEAVGRLLCSHLLQNWE